MVICLHMNENGWCRHVSVYVCCVCSFFFFLLYLDLSNALLSLFHCRSMQLLKTTTTNGSRSLHAFSRTLLLNDGSTLVWSNGLLHLVMSLTRLKVLVSLFYYTSFIQVSHYVYSQARWYQLSSY